MTTLPSGFTLDEQLPPVLPPGFAVDPPHPVAGPSGDLLTDTGRRLGTGVANALGGYLSLPNTVAQGVDWLGNKAGMNPGAQKAIESIPAPGSPDPLFPNFETARNMAFNTTGGTEYQPATWAGRRGQDIINGVMSVSPAQLAMAGPRAALGTFPALAGGSATAGQAAETFPNHPMIAAMLGFVPGAAAGNAIAAAPQRIAAMAGGGTTTEPYGAFTRLGLPTDLAGTTTGAPGPSYAEKFAARMPGSEGHVADARSTLVDAWQSKLNDVAGGMGNAATAQEAGTSLQSAARNWLTDFKDQSATKWNDFWNKVPPTTPVPVSNYQTALTNTLGSFPGASETAGVLQPGTVSGLSKALNVDLGNGGGTLPMQAVKSIRTAIGEKLDTPSLISDTSQAALKQLYGGLTRDIENGAGAVSPSALTAFHRANGFTAAGHDLLENHLNGVLTAPNAEQATQYALSQARQGGSRLGALAFNLPAAAGDLRGYALRQAATNTESPTSLATALTGRKPIYSPEAQNILFGHDPAVQQTVADLATTGNAMKPFEKDLANSPTATHEIRTAGRLVSAAELAKMGHEFAGLPGALAGGAIGLGAPGLMGRAAQATALNPYLAALYGHQIPFQPQNPSLLARALMAPAMAPQLPAPGAPNPLGPAIIPSLAR